MFRRILRLRPHRAPGPGFILFAALILACIWGGSLLSLRYERAGAIAEAEQDAADLALAYEEHIFRTLREIDVLLTLLKRDYGRAPSSFDASRWQGSDLPQNEFMLGCALFDAQGRSIARCLRSSAAVAAEHVRDSIAVHADRDGDGLHIGLPARVDGSNRWSFLVSRRLDDSEGRFVGIVAVAVDSNALAEFYSSISTTRRGSAGLAGLDGIVRARAAGDDRNVGQSLRTSRMFVEHLPRKKEGVYQATSIIDGVLRVYAYRQVREFPLVAVAAISTDEALQDYAMRRNWILTAASILSFLIVGFAVSLMREISRREAEAGRRQAVEREMAEALEHLPVGFAQYDADERLIRFNRQFHDQYRPNDDRVRIGVTAEELIGLLPNLPDLAPTPETLRAWSAERMARFRRPTTPFERFYPGLGYRRVMEAKTPSGGTVSTYSDVTELREMQAALSESRRLLEAVLDAVPVHISVKTADLRYVRVNRAICQTFGLVPESTLGKTAFDVFSREIAESVDYSDHEVLATAKAYGPHELLRRDRHGRWHNMIVTKIPLLDDAGAITHIMTFGIVVTDLKQVEEQLRSLNATLEGRVEERTAELREANDRLARMNEDFSTLINSSPMAITATDLQGRIQLWNPAAERLLGYSAEDVIGRYPPHVTEDTKAEFHDLTARVGRGETIRNLEIRRRRKDGKLIDIAIWLAPRYDTAGRIRGILTIQQDVTEQKEMERRYLQAQKMEAVGRLTGGVAHDFNNLLGIVISNVDLLLARDLAQGQKGILDDILSAAMRGADLTRQLLSFSRRQPLSPEAADANAVVASLSNMAKRMLGDHIEVALALSDGVWPAMVDVGQLETAILNLCVNARDAMPGGGRLTIATSNFANPTDGDARVQELEPGDYVRIQVADSGSGMPPDVAARAFEPFFTTKAVGAGSGLGLSMVYGFAKQSGGHAAIESKPGQGTQVSLYVPRASESVPKARSSGLAPSAPRGKETVLVVEDNDQLRRVLTRQLTELGYRTLEAANGDSALAALQNAPGIDVLFTDVMMPGTLNGHDLIREAMRLRPELKVLMTSGYDGALTQMRPKDLPAHIGMLPKPFRKDELARAIRACLDRPTLH